MGVNVLVSVDPGDAFSATRRAGKHGRRCESVCNTDAGVGTCERVVI